LRAIEEFDELGAGFAIAMRDLEIRGAGNLLGAEQSGHITAVGFELYCQLLKQSVASLKGEKVRPRVEVQVRLDFLAMNAGEEGGAPSSKLKAQSSKEAEPLNISVPRETATYSGDKATKPETRNSKLETRRAAAFLPLNYVPDPQQRIEMYRKLAEITDEEGVSRLKGELRDRCGPLPPPVELLLQVAQLKLLASERGVRVIESKDDKLLLTRNNDLFTVAGRLPRLTRKEPRARLNEIKRLLQTIR
jgi:transcription-repair coupling factor (superfamily II helicase)